MKHFASLLDQLAFEPSRNNKIALLINYFQTTKDPERGWALAAITRDLTIKSAKPALIRELVASRTDPTLFAIAYDYVGDLSETVALMWPAASGPDAKNADADADALQGTNCQPPPTLTEIIDTLSGLPKAKVPAQLMLWLDILDETARWALLKLITGGLRVGVSQRLAKTAVAGLGTLKPDDIEEVWHGLEPPYEALFAWAEGKGARPNTTNPAPFRPPMLAHALEPETDFEKLNPADFMAEWKWDGIRVQLAGGANPDETSITRLYSRTGEELSQAFPDIVGQGEINGAIDGELLIVIDGKIQPFGVLQQRLNRKTVSAKRLKSHPAFVRAYDLLDEGGEDLRPLPFVERRRRLEAFLANNRLPRIDISPLIHFRDWEQLAAARSDPENAGAGDDAESVEGVMIKRCDSGYVPGRPKGPWFKWKRDPLIIDAVLMYAQRGHGKRSSFYSDYTFGVWRASPEGDELVPLGKAYFGFTDEELREIDRFVRRHTTNRFGPVREVAHTAELGLVLEVAFEGLNRSTRHKSGVAMRFPRISRLRWDKPPAEADRIEALEALLPKSTGSPEAS